MFTVLALIREVGVPDQSIPWREILYMVGHRYAMAPHPGGFYENASDVVSFLRSSRVRQRSSQRTFVADMDAFAYESGAGVLSFGKLLGR